MKPMPAPIRPAYATACGTAINAMPTYILIILAAVSSQFVVLTFFVSGVKCLSENYEFVYFGHLSDGFELLAVF
jgi:hypothetical protein